MTDCSLCSHLTEPVGCSMENHQLAEYGKTMPIESPCPDFVQDLWVDKPKTSGSIHISLSPTLNCIEERQDMKNYFVFKGMCPLGNQRWEVYQTNNCLRSRGVEPVHLATIHEPLTDNPGWQFHSTFGQSGIQEALVAFGRVKQIFEDMAVGYGAVAG